MNLRNEKKEEQNTNRELRKIITELGGEIPVLEDEYIGIYEAPRVTTNQVYNIVEQMPEFPGGFEKMIEFLAKNITYPQGAKEAGVKGKVYVEFVVQKDGSLEDIKVVRGIGSGCDEEAYRAVKAMPNWIPGEQRGKKVNVKFILPINFYLR